MDLSSPLVILVLLFTGSVAGDYSDVKSNGDYSDEFVMFVQTFLANILSSNEFTKSEKEDLHTIVNTVGTVITAPMRRGSDLLRKMRIFNVAVITSIAETIGADSDQNPEKAKRKANAIAKALKSAFNTVSKDNSNNQQLISEVRNMVNMFSRLEEQESLDLNFLTTMTTNNQNEDVGSVTDSHFPLKSSQNQPNIPYMNSPPISEGPGQGIPVESTPTVPLIQTPNPSSILPRENSTKTNLNNDTVPTTHSPGNINWNFVFCIYNELFSSSAFTTVFTSNLPYERAITYIRRISASLARSFFYGRLTENDISSTFSEALTFLHPVPTTEEFAYMFGQELSKMISNQGMFDKSNPCRLASSIAREIEKNLNNLPNQKTGQNSPLPNSSNIGGKPPLPNSLGVTDKPPLPYLVTIPSLNIDLKLRRILDFERKLRTRLLSSEIFYTAFQRGIKYDKLTDYAFAVGSFLPATPEYRSLNISRLSTALTESLRTVKSPAVANQYATALITVISSFMEDNGLLNDTNIDKQASRVGTIILNALCTQITTNFQICARKQRPRTRVVPKFPNIPKPTRNVLLPSTNVGNDEGTSQLSFPNNMYSTTTVFDNMANDNKEAKNLITTTFSSNDVNQQTPTITDPTTTDLRKKSETKGFTGTDTSIYETDKVDSTTYISNASTMQTSDTEKGGSDNSTTELSQSNVDASSEPLNTESNTIGYDNFEFTDEYSPISTEPNDITELTTTIEEQKEDLITQLTEEIHRAEQSGTTEELVRTLTDFVTELYTNNDEGTLETSSTETATETNASVASTQEVTSTENIRAETDETSTGNISAETDETSTGNISAETGETSTEISTTECDTSDTTSSEVTTSISKDLATTTLEDITDFSTESGNSTTADPQSIYRDGPPGMRNRKNVSQLPKSPTWLFESALIYSLMSSENFVDLFKPKTRVADAKSYSFKMAESVASLPQFNFRDSIFHFGHAYYSAVQKVQPNATTDAYAKAFANASSEIVKEKEILTKQNQVPLAIATGNAIHDSLSEEKPLKKNNKKSNMAVTPFDVDDGTSTSLENLLSTLNNGDAKTKKELLSKTLSDIGEVIGNKDLQPRTLLIKLLMETVVAAVNVIISEKNQ